MAAPIHAPRRLADPRAIEVLKRSYDFIDVLERTLTKGVAFEIEDDVDATAVDRDALDSSAWFRLSIVGVGVFKIGAGMSWRYFFEAEEEDREEISSGA